MLMISKETRLSGEAVLEKASLFFGRGGLGLVETERNSCCIYFEGGGGFVSIKLEEADKHRRVDIETREWEFPVKDFLDRL
jgi:hypothetical protein